MTKFAIISVGLQTKYIAAWYKSVVGQLYTDWLCYVSIDPSDYSDHATKAILKAVLSDDRFNIQINQNKKYCLRNTYECIKKVTHKNTIIVILDIDDSFYTKDALHILARYYQDNDVWLTYGSYKDSNGNNGNWCQNISDKVWKNDSHRNSRWSAGPLRTFRKWLWDKIDQKDFLMPDGSWIKRATDRSFMYPMLEMSGKNHVRYIGDILYLYNLYNQQLSMNKIEEEALKHILSKKPYQQLKENHD